MLAGGSRGALSLERLPVLIQSLLVSIEALRQLEVLPREGVVEAGRELLPHIIEI